LKLYQNESLTIFILCDLLTTLQEEFSNTQQGLKSKIRLAYTLLAVVVPFTLSITSNLLHDLQTLSGLEIQSQRFHAFMGSQLFHGEYYRGLYGETDYPSKLRLSQVCHT